jgi:ribonucleotide reductase alpha subunit
MIQWIRFLRCGVSFDTVSSMQIFNTATEVVKQGSARHGANMEMLRINRSS